MTYSKLMYTAKNSQVQKIWKQMGMKELFVVMGSGGRGREGESGGGRGWKLLPLFSSLSGKRKRNERKKTKSTFINN